MEWIKLWTRKWLWGSGRNMTPEKRGVWIDILALAAEGKLRDGTLRFDVGQPMSRAWIAASLMIDPQSLDACLAAFQADLNADDSCPRISIWDDGTIQITNWERFQGKSDKVKSKETAIESGKETKRRNRYITDRLAEAVNQLNYGLKQRRFELMADGKVLDTQNGEIKTIEEMEG